MILFVEGRRIETAPLEYSLNMMGSELIVRLNGNKIVLDAKIPSLSPSVGAVDEEEDEEEEEDYEDEDEEEDEEAF